MLETEKEHVRDVIRERMRVFNWNQRCDGSASIRQTITSLDLWKESRCVALFAPFHTEPNVDPLFDLALEEKKIVTYPRAIPKDNTMQFHFVDKRSRLVKGYGGIKEPHPLSCDVIELSKIDLLLVPGIAFDRNCNRLGRGKGYFDRLIAKEDFRATTVGCFFSFQEVEDVPTAPHDQPLDYVITENLSLPKAR